MSPRRLGQHFLSNPGWRARIAAALAAQSDDVWLEIGAGHGEMTALLARSGARVLALELDPRLLDRLGALAREQPNIEIVPGDILQLDLSSLLASASRLATGSGLASAARAGTQASPRHGEQARHGGQARVKVYGSLPYYITSPILHRLFEHAERIASIYVVIQFEVAARLVARPGRREYGYLSVLTQFYSQPEIVLRIPPGAFRPPPKVTSALVSMRLSATANRPATAGWPAERSALGITDEAGFLEFVKACFAQKRKTLLNNLRALMGVERAMDALRDAGLSPTIRAEQLSLAQFAALYRRLPSI